MGLRCCDDTTVAVGECVRETVDSAGETERDGDDALVELVAPLVTANAVNAAAAAATNGRATVDTISGVREREFGRWRLRWCDVVVCVGDDCGDLPDAASFTLQQFTRLSFSHIVACSSTAILSLAILIISYS